MAVVLEFTVEVQPRSLAFTDDERGRILLDAAFGLEPDRHPNGPGENGQAETIDPASREPAPAGIRSCSTRASQANTYYETRRGGGFVERSIREGDADISEAADNSAQFIIDKRI